MNRVILDGYVARTPQAMTVGPRQRSLLDVRLEVPRANGRRDYVNVKIWGELAERVAPYLAEGRHILIDGALQHSRWWDAIGPRRGVNAGPADGSPEDRSTGGASSRDAGASEHGERTGGRWLERHFVVANKMRFLDGYRRRGGPEEAAMQEAHARNAQLPLTVGAA